MKEINLGFVVLSLMSMSVLAIEDPFAELDRELSAFETGFTLDEKKQDALESEFAQYKKSISNEYKEYEKQILAEYAQYKKEVAKVWGNEKAKLSDKKTWVDYSGNKTERSRVDFEKGEVTVELALSLEETKDPALVQQKLMDAVTRLITKQADERSIADVNNTKQAPTRQVKKPPVLANQIKMVSGSLVTEKNAVAFSQELLKLKEPITEKIKGTDGKKRILVKTSFKLVPNHIKKRAEKFKKKVVKEAARQELNMTLVFAIMQTESNFNPMARSAVPAFGLMQLVPSSGAQDAYLYLHKKKKVVSDGYLYNSNNNIEMGSAYLHILKYRYLRQVKDSNAKCWCVIAAYNTGSGNVFRAFVGKYSRAVFGSRKEWKRQAFSKINSMTSEAVYQHLRRHLPHDETKQYVKRVRDRMDHYIGWREVS